MKVINVGGAINSGKSTVSEILAGKLKNAVFIEVDDLLSEEEERLFPDFPARIEERLRRLYAELGRHLRERRFDHVIFAYPMTERTYAAIRGFLRIRRRLSSSPLTRRWKNACSTAVRGN